jgi:hypothetical protein
MPACRWALVPVLILGLLGGVLAACEPLGLGGGGEAPRPERRYFRFVEAASGETFVAATADSLALAQVEAELARPPADRNKLIIGSIERGDGLYPDGYPWHFVPDAWRLADLATEVCDGRPSYVSAHVDYFVDEVGRYCPFGSRLVEEVPPPQ